VPTNRQLAALGEHQPRPFREGVRKAAMIAENFIIAKDFCAYTTIILRQDKSLRDHAPPAGSGGHDAA
jgi:hypothetical protein